MASMWGSRAPIGIGISTLVAGLLAFAPPASANISHVFTATYGGGTSTPADPYPLSAPTDVAVDQSTHDFYVTDPGSHAVEKFSPSGEFILMFGGNVDQKTGANVCTAASADPCQAGVSGSGSGELETPTYLAVDNSGGPSNGDIYVGDTGDSIVSKFEPSGQIVSTWGVEGQKDGSDATDHPLFGPLGGTAVDSSGTIYILGYNYSGGIWQYSQSGEYKGWFSQGPGLFSVEGNPVSIAANIAVDPSTNEIYEVNGSEIDHYFSDCLPCEPLDRFGNGDLFAAKGIAIDGSTHTVYVANAKGNDVAAFDDVRPVVTTGSPLAVSDSSVTLTGQVEPKGHGEITECKFEYGFDTTYGHSIPCSPDPRTVPFTENTAVTATIDNFSPGTRDHYRLVATNSAGATVDGLDKTFTTTQAPAIDGVRAEKVTATSADLIGQIDPNGLPTTYRFEYGPTIDYGQDVPVPDGTIEASFSDQERSVELTGLTPHAVYHYRVVAENEDGITNGEDHSFNFYPSSCPNETVRQQTEADYLPDCRAYELVSPGNAGATALYPGGPNTGYATNPPRLAYTGSSGTLPESGGSPIDANGDLYIATRTDSGWVSRYVGLPSFEAALDGGPPQGPPGSGFPGEEIELCSQPGGDCGPAKIQNNVLTNSAMSTFLEFDDGNPAVGANNQGDLQNESTVSSNAPYVYGSEGNFLERLPTDLGAVSPIAHALDCKRLIGDFFGHEAYNDCPGDVTASANLTHFVFATETHLFSPQGQLAAPGSVYDNDVATANVEVASKLSDGEPIPSQPTDQAGDPLQIPAVSSDGSRILMAAGGTGPCGASTCSEPPCGAALSAYMRCPMQASNLYMRVDDSITHDISQGHDVNYVGMTADGSKVYFTSEEQLTEEDKDTSTDLYMWSEVGEEEGHPLTLVSGGGSMLAGEPGNTDSCSASFTTRCGVVTYSGRRYCQLPGGLGGNCNSDSSIASESGDIFFFSPEQLDGSKGIPNQWNLYDYRSGRDHFVASFSSPYCFSNPFPTCANTPVVRMQVTPDGAHMAFITASQITQYNNAGHLEMYTYEPATETVLCVSCNPSGAPPTSDVYGSQDGLFLTTDGRTFFSTEEALVHNDTNNAQDVYEYVEGSPQLITQGTGDTRGQTGANDINGNEGLPGLDGVSANGTDVYFSTYDTLVPQDHNGTFLKFYDARSGGGFPLPTPPAACEAADECHGVGSSSPSALQGETSVALRSGNAASATHRDKVRKARRRRRRARRTGRAQHGHNGGER